MDPEPKIKNEIVFSFLVALPAKEPNVPLKDSEEKVYQTLLFFFFSFFLGWIFAGVSTRKVKKRIWSLFYLFSKMKGFAN